MQRTTGLPIGEAICDRAHGARADGPPSGVAPSPIARRAVAPSRRPRRCRSTMRRRRRQPHARDSARGSMRRSRPRYATSSILGRDGTRPGRGRRPASVVSPERHRELDPSLVWEVGEPSRRRPLRRAASAPRRRDALAGPRAGPRRALGAAPRAPRARERPAARQRAHPEHADGDGLPRRAVVRRSAARRAWWTAAWCARPSTRAGSRPRTPRSATRPPPSGATHGLTSEPALRRLAAPARLDALRSRARDAANGDRAQAPPADRRRPGRATTSRAIGASSTSPMLGARARGRPRRRAPARAGG